MTRVPTEADFAGLAPDLAVALHFPDPPASTTAILLLFHGLGDAESAFLAFARAINLPGVLAIAVRGPSVVPPLLVLDAGAADDDADGMALGDGPQHFHWGDDLQLRRRTDADDDDDDDDDGDDDGAVLDDDPGFDRAVRLVHDRLVRGVLVDHCGWRRDDVLLFGFGQGATFALALAARTEREATPPARPLPYKGLVAVAPALPSAVTMGPTAASARLATPLLVCGPAGGGAVAAEAEAVLRRHVSSVQLVRWPRTHPGDTAMPRSRAEMLPVMAFLAARLQGRPGPDP